MRLKIDDGSNGKGRGPAVKNDKNKSQRSMCEARGSRTRQECRSSVSAGAQCLAPGGGKAGRETKGTSLT